MINYSNNTKKQLIEIIRTKDNSLKMSDTNISVLKSNFEEKNEQAELLKKRVVTLIDEARAHNTYRVEMERRVIDVERAQDALMEIREANDNRMEHQIKLIESLRTVIEQHKTTVKAMATHISMQGES